MVSKEETWQALGNLSQPMLGRSLGGLNLVRSVRCSDHRVDLEKITSLNWINIGGVLCLKKMRIIRKIVPEKTE